MYAKKLKKLISLRLFHEIYILDDIQQFYEYVACHEETGMLKYPEKRGDSRSAELLCDFMMFNFCS